MARFLRVFSQASFILAALVAACGLIAAFMGEVTQGLAVVGIAIGSVVPLGILRILTESAGILTEIRELLNVWLIESQRELRAEVGGIVNPAYKPIENEFESAARRQAVSLNSPNFDRFAERLANETSQTPKESWDASPERSSPKVLLAAGSPKRPQSGSGCCFQTPEVSPEAASQ